MARAEQRADEDGDDEPDIVEEGDDEPDILLQRRHGQHVVELRFNRPHRLNALNAALFRRAAAALRALSAHAATRVVVLTAAGARSFCSGMDVRAIGDAAGARAATRAARAFMLALMRCRKVLVAAAFGRVVGVGVTLLLHCDFVYCDARSTFHTPFARLALPPEFASSLTLRLFGGKQLAARMLLRGERVRARHMRDAGVCELVQGDVLGAVLQRCLKWVREADDAQWNAVCDAKALIKQPTVQLIEGAMRSEFELIEQSLLKQDTVARFGAALRSAKL